MPADGMTVARRVPVEASLDRRQAAAVLRLLLGHGLRPGIDASSGVRGNPVRQILIGLGLFGLVFMPNAWRCADLGTYLVVLFTATLVLVLITITPETQEVRERHLEILGSKPLSRRTLFAARGLLLAVMGSIITTAFSALPLAAARLRFAAPYPRLAMAWVCLVLGAFVAAVTSLVLVVVALRWWRPEQVRRVSQTSMGVFFVALSAASLLASSGLFLRPHGADLLSIAGGPMEWLPSTWFARLAVGEGGPYLDVQRVAAFALVAAAFFMVGGGGLERVLPSFLESTALPEARTSRPLAARLLRRLARVPWLGGWVLPRRPAALAEAVVSHAQREELARARDLMTRLMALVAFALSVAGVVPPTFATALFIYVVIGAAAEGVRVGRQCTTPEAGWLFQKAPLRGGELLRGLEAAAYVRAGWLPILLLLALALWLYGPALGLLLVVGALAMVKIAVGAAVALDPGAPLSREPVAASFNEMAVSLGLGWGLVAGYTILILLVDVVGRWVLVLVALADVALITLAWMSGVFAAWRLERALAGR